MNQELARSIASEIQIFQSVEQKEKLLFLIGALMTRVITLKKAAEVLEIEPGTLLKILDLLNIEFSYLSEDDVLAERSW